MAIDGVNGANKTQGNINNGAELNETTTSQKTNSIFEKSEEKSEIKQLAEEAAKKDLKNQKQLSRKEANIWLKNYQEQNGVSKKEARAAFKETFGYGVPDTKFIKGLKFVATSATFGFSGLGIAQEADLVSGGKLGINKFIKNLTD